MTTKHLILRIAGLVCITVTAALNADLDSLMIVTGAAGSMVGVRIAKRKNGSGS